MSSSGYTEVEAQELKPADLGQKIRIEFEDDGEISGFLTPSRLPDPPPGHPHQVRVASDVPAALCMPTHDCEDMNCDHCYCNREGRDG